jgi:hypothetical protein
MLRLIGGIIAGVVAWFIIVTVLDIGLRFGWPAYGAVEKAMAFTLPMMIARLSISAISSLLSGYVAATIEKGKWAALVAGIVLLVLFVPIHYGLWAKFPAWYHLTFLVSLPVLSLAGGRLMRPRLAMV